ncbi:hypothetical protein NMG60_11022177 [Bertholletia excelsa]
MESETGDPPRKTKKLRKNPLIKVKYISSPVKVQANNPTEFSAIVQELTGQNSDPATMTETETEDANACNSVIPTRNYQPGRKLQLDHHGISPSSMPALIHREHGSSSFTTSFLEPTEASSLRRVPDISYGFQYPDNLK